ncbi:MAG TPA: IS1380 family transposase [Chloroflexota bacterium]|nr:IS1380 family transposase [Chloroflexota bacterium]
MGADVVQFGGAAGAPQHLPLPLEACFDGGRVTSDGGLAWVREADVALGVCAGFGALVPEWRRGPVRHTLETLVRQRVFQIACGYADQNDAATLRSDPLLKLVCGRLPETGRDLASQPTFSRLENAVRPRDCYRLALALLEVYLHERARVGSHLAPAGRSRRPRRVLLDLDGTDDPTHGDQEGSAYHGYYGQHMYFPLLVFDGDTNQLVTAVLRPGNAHGSHGVVAILKRLVPRLRARWPGVRIELRADSGFAIPALFDYCDAERIAYTIGLIPNPRLEAIAAPLLVEAQRQLAEQHATGAAGAAKVRLAGATRYAAQSWSHERRVVYKAEALVQGPNTRFVVTTSTAPPLAVYDRYVDRGESENWIKDFKRACAGDRLSDHRFVANQFRLLLHAAAYWLLDTLRRWLLRAGVERLQLDTLRLRLLKIGGVVREWLTTIRLHLATSHPGEPLWRLLATRPNRPVNNPG